MTPSKALTGVSLATIVLCIPLSVSAGTCDCSPEIDNASAKMTDDCGKVWADDHCTLKEAGVSNYELLSSIKKGEWAKRVESHLDFGLTINSAYRSSVTPMLSNIGLLNGSILRVLSEEVPPDFAASVFRAVNEHAYGIEKYWSAHQTYSWTEDEIRISVGNQCFYSSDRRRDLNFYVNFSQDESRCAVIE